MFTKLQEHFYLETVRRLAHLTFYNSITVILEGNQYTITTMEIFKNNNSSYVSTFLFSGFEAGKFFFSPNFLIN